jgi:glucose-1-phosphate adenylyltransferase
VSSVYVMILAGGVGSRLSILTEQRAKPAVPFGGKFRIIDFALSNCANSGLFDVGLLTQYRPMSLIEHVGTGRTWDLDRTLGGLQILQPYLEAESGDWYQGTADAVWRNLVQITQRSVEDVIILSGDHVYAMDYRPLLRFHRERRFPATIAVTPVPPELTRHFGIVQTDSRAQITGFQEKPKEADGNLASMGIYVFRRETLIRLLQEGGDEGAPRHDFGKDIFPRLIQVADVGAHTFDGYWQDIGTVESFYESNMKLLDPHHSLKLARPSWPIRTPSVEAPPARVWGRGTIKRSLAANGAVVRGTVENSILFPGVVVHEGAVVRDSILMNDVHVHANAQVIRAILDKRAHVDTGAHIGGEGPGDANATIPELLVSGITLLGKDARVGDGARIGRNACIGAKQEVDAGDDLPDGAYREGRLGRPGLAAARC